MLLTTYSAENIINRKMEPPCLPSIHSVSCPQEVAPPFFVTVTYLCIALWSANCVTLVRTSQEESLLPVTSEWPATLQRLVEESVEWPSKCPTNDWVSLRALTLRSLPSGPLIPSRLHVAVDKTFSL